MDVVNSDITNSSIPTTLPSISVKLLEKNYSIWRSQILPALTSHGLQAKCNTAYEIWNILELHFQSTSKARTLHLQNLLQTTKKDAYTVSEYVLKMSKLGDELIASGMNITDEELLLYILDGLGPKYDVVVANLTSNNSQTTLQEAQFLLHKHEIRLERQHSSFTSFHDQMASTLVASKKKKNANESGLVPQSQHVSPNIPDVNPGILQRYSHLPNSASFQSPTFMNSQP
ncbi:uncharacterized protein LOC116142726 [Pistacia vera]|uniref:uncharacterized protein LOC116142726 n=1 Tax=Pistacia vera TaxID=55513 RepID=UPI001262BD8C|nr:uncharacterized protein LOC116142726 [Pistacia vera]